jgi:8-oxo-dGTP diphosphatase
MFRFNIRVYGILVDPQQRILVSDELIRGKRYTKFPGGGLEYGEGTRDCLKREFMEEMGLRVEVKEHLYTTDYFQESAFHPDHQIISIYYRVEPLEEITARLSDQAFDFDEEQMRRYEGSQEIETFRFIEWKDLKEESVSLPIDSLVVRMLLEEANRPQAGS